MLLTVEFSIADWLFETEALFNNKEQFDIPELSEILYWKFIVWVPVEEYPSEGEIKFISGEVVS